MAQDVLQLHCQQILALVVIMHSCGRIRLDTPPAVSKFAFCDSCIKHYVAKSVHVATGKQETAKEAQVCSVESMLKCCDVKRGGRGVKH